MISVPNDFSVPQMEVCNKYNLPYYWLIPPIHLNYFSPKCLQLPVRRCGFIIRDMRGTYPLEERMLQEDGQNYVGNSSMWQLYTDAKIAMELGAIRAGTWNTLETEYRENMKDRRGRSIICIAQKV